MSDEVAENAEHPENPSVAPVAASEPTKDTPRDVVLSGLLAGIWGAFFHAPTPGSLVEAHDRVVGLVKKAWPK